MSAMSVAEMPRTRWPKHRVFRLGFLVGRGFKPAEIAIDPLVQSTPAMVKTMTNNMGGAFSDVPGGNLMINLSRPRLAALDAEAKRRQQTTEAMIGLAVGFLADDKTLLDNVLDDLG